MDGLSTAEIFARGYAIPHYTLYAPPYCYKYREEFITSNVVPTVRLPGVPYPVAAVEQVRG